MALRIDKSRVVEGVTVFIDDMDEALVYVLPDSPRYRINESDGRPAFSFFKYRSPIDRPDGKKGGGLLVFDAELVLSNEKQQAVLLALQAELDQRYANTGKPAPRVKIGAITFTRGTTRLNIESLSSNFVEKLFNPGKPSLYGKNITPFTVELSAEGSTFFEAALQNKGGFVQVTYDMFASVRLPPVEIRLSFDASKFYSFVQDFKLTTKTQGVFDSICQALFGGSNYSERKVSESVGEIATQNEWGHIDVNMGAVIMPDPKADAELKQKLRDWAFSTFAEAIKRTTPESAKPVSAEERQIPKDLTELKQAVSNFKFSSFDITYREGMVVEWPMIPQGTLEPIVNLKDKKGEPLKWSEFSQMIDLNDPVFQTLEVPVRVNANFKDLPLDSVEVKCEYHSGQTHQIQELSFTSPDTMEKFRTFVEAGEWSYTYSYQVNYKGQSRSFQSPPIHTNEKFLTINVGDTGILAIDVEVGDLSFEQVSSALVTLTYEDRSGAVAIERQFQLTKATPRHSLREVVFTPVSQPYQYQVKYTMADGTEVIGPVTPSRSPQLYINDPFTSTRTIALRATGNLDTEIQTIFTSMRFVDEKAKYEKKISVALSKAQPGFDWIIPLINPDGKVFYSFTIQYRDGRIEEGSEHEAKSDTILAGRLDTVVLEVTVLPSLVDFTKTQLVDVALHYVDKEGEIDTRADLIFEPKDKEKKTWSVRVKDRTKMKYEWQTTFFMADGSTKQSTVETTEARALILRMPN